MNYVKKILLKHVQGCHNQQSILTLEYNKNLTVDLFLCFVHRATFCKGAFLRKILDVGD